MPAGLQVVNFAKTAISGSAWESVSVVSGDSATFFNVPQGSPAFVGEIWAVNNLHACEISVTGSRWHDQTYGVRAAVTSGAATAPTLRSVVVSPIGVDQPIYPSDTLTVQVNGTASDDVIVTLVIYYQDIPGISARLASLDYVKSNTKNLVGINTNVTPGDDVYGTSVALNASDNRLHANTDYAVLGFTSSLPLATLYIQGIDTGNLKVGGPVLGEPDHDANLFVNFAKALNMPLIPIINSNNAGSTNLAAIGTDQSAATVDVLLAELKQPFTG